MRKTNNQHLKNQVFVKDTNMETQTVFMANGHIDIYPCSFEQGQHIVANGKDKASQKGRMVTDDNGTSHFRPYRKDSAVRYTPLMQTEHGEMKSTKKEIKIVFRFKKSLSAEQVAKAMHQEMAEMEKWMETRSTKTCWD